MDIPLKTDGKAFKVAVSLSEYDNETIIAKMKESHSISKTKFYKLYEKESFEQFEKEAASKALGRTVEDIFGVKEAPDNQYTVIEGQNKEVIMIGKHPYRRLKPDEYTEAFKAWPGVPMYNVPVTASFVQTYRDESVFHPQYYLHDPRFKDCNFGAIITGDSMYSEIRHGDFVVCQEIVDKDFIVYGDIYYVVSTNGLETCKYINADPKNDNNFLLVPRNESISPSPIPKRMIERLFKVRGVVRGY